MRVKRDIALAAVLVAGKAYLPEGGDISVHVEGTYQFGSSILSRPAAWYASAAAGVGLAVVDRDSAGTKTTTRRFTVPVEAQLAWRPLRHLGLVLCGFASFNSRERFGGLTFGLQLGRLR